MIKSYAFQDIPHQGLTTHVRLAADSLRQDMTYNAQTHIECAIAYANMIGDKAARSKLFPHLNRLRAFNRHKARRIHAYQ